MARRPSFTGSRASDCCDRATVLLPSSLLFHHRIRCGTSPRSFANCSIDWPLLRQALRTPRASCSDHCPRCAMQGQNDLRIQIRAAGSLIGCLPTDGTNVVSTAPVSRTSWMFARPDGPTTTASTTIRSPSRSNDVSDLIRHLDARETQDASGGLNDHG